MSVKATLKQCGYLKRKIYLILGKTEGNLKNHGFIHK